MAHITGGGLPENLPRCLPPGVHAAIDPDSWERPPVFRWLQERGQVPEADLWNTFNLGVGFCLVVPPDACLASSTSADPRATRPGSSVGSRQGAGGRIPWPDCRTEASPGRIRPFPWSWRHVRHDQAPLAPSRSDDFAARCSIRPDASPAAAVPPARFRPSAPSSHGPACGRAAMVQQREGSGGQRPTFLTLRDHGKVYVADLPRLSDGQLTHIAKEAEGRPREPQPPPPGTGGPDLPQRGRSGHPHPGHHQAGHHPAVPQLHRPGAGTAPLQPGAAGGRGRIPRPRLPGAGPPPAARRHLRLPAPGGPQRLRPRRRRLPSAANRPTPRWSGCCSAPKPPSPGRRPCRWC